MPQKTQSEVAVNEEMARRLNDDDFLLHAVGEAVHAALRDHQEAGNPVAAWQNGQVVLLGPDEVRPLLEGIPPALGFR